MDTNNYPYGRQPPQGGARGANNNPGSNASGSTGGGAAAANTANLMGMPQAAAAAYEGADMRAAARYSMGHMPMAHAGMGLAGMDPAMAMGYSRGGHEAAMRESAMMQGHPGFQGGFDMSPSMARMTAGNMYAQMQQQQQQQQPPQPQQPQQPGNSPNYASNGARDAAGMAEMGANSEGRANRGGDATGQAGMSSSGGSGGGPGGIPPGSLSQAEKEEELLLNLLIARRQRTRMTGEPPSARQDGYFADELLRLRQARAAGLPGQGPSMARGGGTLPPMPGMPPIYMDHPVGALSGVSGNPTNVGFTGHAYRDIHHPLQSDVALNLPIQEGVDQRIDRTPPQFMDARTQDMMMMRDFSGRGIKRGPYDMSGQVLMHGHAPQQMQMQMKYQMQGMDVTPQGKKKRSHKKKPADMPRRPLSAYNLCKLCVCVCHCRVPLFASFLTDAIFNSVMPHSLFGRTRTHPGRT